MIRYVMIVLYGFATMMSALLIIILKLKLLRSNSQTVLSTSAMSSRVSTLVSIFFLCAGKKNIDLIDLSNLDKGRLLSSCLT